MTLNHNFSFFKLTDENLMIFLVDGGDDFRAMELSFKVKGASFVTVEFLNANGDPITYLNPLLNTQVTSYEVSTCTLNKTCLIFLMHSCTYIIKLLKKKNWILNAFILAKTNFFFYLTINF